MSAREESRELRERLDVVREELRGLTIYKDGLGTCITLCTSVRSKRYSSNSVGVSYLPSSSLPLTTPRPHPDPDPDDALDEHRLTLTAPETSTPHCLPAMDTRNTTAGPSARHPRQKTPVNNTANPHNISAAGSSRSQTNLPSATIPPTVANTSSSPVSMSGKAAAKSSSPVQRTSRENILQAQRRPSAELTNELAMACLIQPSTFDADC